MATLEEVARKNLQWQEGIAASAQADVLALWLKMSPDDLPASWATLGPVITARIAEAQLAAASAVDPYMAALARAQQIADGASASVLPSSFSGIASDGRPLDTLLLQAVRTAARLLAGGVSPASAMVSGSANLLMHTATQVFDAARAAEQTGAASRPWARYSVRVCSPRACSRCVVLSGRHYRWNTQFRRHPNCGCQNVSAARADDLGLDSPLQIFNALSPDDQNRRFTVAGAEAIRLGADVNQVVNVRRGMTTATVAGVDLRVTTSGIGRDSSYAYQRRAIDALVGRSGRQTHRLMPEQIILLANGRKSEALRLLIANGYLLDGGYAELAARYVALAA